MSKLNENIIKGLSQNRPQAMKQIFDLYYAPLCGYAARYTADMTTAEEIVSDMMYKIWQNRHNGYRAETFREYLFTATYNTALNHLKQKQNIRKLSDNWAEQLRHELIEETPLDALIADEMQSKFDKLIENLPEQCRKIFLLSRAENMTYEDIANNMDISINTVKYHIKMALQKIRSGMGKFMIWIFLLCKIFF